MTSFCVTTARAMGRWLKRTSGKRAVGTVVLLAVVVGALLAGGGSRAQARPLAPDFTGRELIKGFVFTVGPVAEYVHSQAHPGSPFVAPDGDVETRADAFVDRVNELDSEFVSTLPSLLQSGSAELVDHALKRLSELHSDVIDRDPNSLATASSVELFLITPVALSFAIVAVATLVLNINEVENYGSSIFNGLQESVTFYVNSILVNQPNQVFFRPGENGTLAYDSAIADIASILRASE
jgi:SdpC family antimicrobial peptide